MTRRGSRLEIHTNLRHTPGSETLYYPQVPELRTSHHSWTIPQVGCKHGAHCSGLPKISPKCLNDQRSSDQPHNSLSTFPLDVPSANFPAACPPRRRARLRLCQVTLSRLVGITSREHEARCSQGSADFYLWLNHRAKLKLRSSRMGS